MASKNVAAEKKIDKVKDTANLSLGLIDENENKDFQVVNPDLNWYKVEDREGNKIGIRGVVLERRQRPDNAGYYYVIGLTRPTTLFDRDQQPIPAIAGDYAWVDERYDLQALQKYLPRRTDGLNGVGAIMEIVEVVIIPTKKVTIKGGKSMWKFEIRAWVKGPNPETMPLLAPATTTIPNTIEKGTSEDIPF